MLDNKNYSPLEHFGPCGKFLLSALWILIIGMFVNAGMSVYFYNFHDKPSVTWKNRNFPTTTPFVHQGDPVIFIVEQCSKDTFIATVSREIVDGIAYNVPEQSITFQKGCVREERIVADVTKNIPPGVYHVSSTVEITERWLWFSRVDKYQTGTDSFTILPKGQIDPEAATTEK